MIDFKKLAENFDPADVKVRTGNASFKPKEMQGSCMVLAYVDARVVMDRLDEVVGPQNWFDEYQPGPDGGVMCTIYVNTSHDDYDSWIGKSDVAENTQFEQVKGGVSDAFKRAAVKWGIGRYLYNLPTVWSDCKRSKQEADSNTKKRIYFADENKTKAKLKASL